MAMGIVASVKLPFDVSEMPRRRPDPLTDLRARRVRVRRAPARARVPLGPSRAAGELHTQRW